MFVIVIVIVSSSGVTPSVARTTRSKDASAAVSSSISPQSDTVIIPVDAEIAKA